MKRYNLDPQRVAEHLATQDRIVNAFAADLQELVAAISEFWEFYGPVVEVHLQELRKLKVVFGGDIFPSYTANIACSVGLYADTIILPDPLSKLITFAETMPAKELFRLTIKHALNALSYREVALAELETPIVVIAPDYLADHNYREALEVASEEDELQHYSEVFGMNFATREQFHQFLHPLSNLDSLISHIVHPDRVLFDTDWSGPLRGQFQRYESEFMGQFWQDPDPRFVMEFMIKGRMMQINDALFRSSRYGGTPLIDAPTSWRYLQWKFEYDGDENTSKDSERELLIAKSIELEGQEHGMLMGVPPEVLIDLRKNGALEELRLIISKGIGDVESASDENLSAVGKQVIGNIDSALSEHARQLQTLSLSKKKFYGIDIGRWIVPGGLSVAASVAHSVPLGFLAAISTMSGSLRPEELRARYRELRSEATKLRRSPTGIMFRHVRKNFGL